MFNFRNIIAVGIAACINIATAQAAELDLKLLAPASPGGGWDTAARSLQQVMQDSEIANVQVINVPGAGGTVGLAQFVNQAQGAKDQLLIGGITMVGAILTNKSPVNLDQITPLARLTGDPLVVVVPATSPIKTIQDLATAAKADVGGTVWAGGSAGGADHMLAALITQAVGTDASKVNYVAFSGGGEALSAMLGARVTAGISGYGEFESQIKAGALRALAISSGSRLEGVDVPTLKEQGIDIEMVNWRGIFAAPGISDADKAELVAAIEKTVKSPEWVSMLKAKGWTDFYAPANEFKTFLTSKNERVGAVLKSIGLVE